MERGSWRPVWLTVAFSSIALEKLCARYWHPIHTFVRRQVSDPEEAQDLTQNFFARLLGHEAIKKADRRKGKFRSFLLGELLEFLKERQKQRHNAYPTTEAQIVSLNEISPNELERQQPVDSSLPDKLFDRAWALAMLEATLARLREEYVADGKTELYEKLKPELTGKADLGWHATVAAELAMSEGAIRVALHRLRRRFGELLRKEVGRTVPSATEINDELRHLFGSLETDDQ